MDPIHGSCNMHRASINNLRNEPAQPTEPHKRLSLASKTPLPPSPGPLSPHIASFAQRASASANQRHSPSPLPLRRSSSNISLGQRAGAASPSLMKKASTQSLRNGLDSPRTPSRLNSRRSSTHLNAASPGTPLARALSPFVPKEEPEPLTAAKVATEFFEKELASHAKEDSTAGTIVILHDACYGHRYSRPKTTKTLLSMIVERPERIHAGILGVSAAYVRLGERHAAGRHAPHPERQHSTELPFKIRRTSRVMNLTSAPVTAVHGTAWMQELNTMCVGAEAKLATTGKELSREGNYDAPGQPPKAKLHEGDLYLCKDSLDAFQGALGGVCDGIDAVFQGVQSGTGPSSAFVCVRPPGHHCSADFPSGFCWLNNVHVGIQYAAQTYGLTHAAILDFDLHHGDGSQSVTWQHNDRVKKLPKNTPNSKKTAIAYFSLHDINSYPCEEGDIDKVQNASLCLENAHGQTIWNVHLQPWKDEQDFWALYETRYSVLIEKARCFLHQHSETLRGRPNQPQPKAAIFISAGFDASEWEGAGMQRHKVNVPTEFYARFTQDVVKLAKEEDVAVEGRIISVLEGGYSDRALMSGVLSHLSGLCDRPPVAIKTELKDEHGLGYEIAQRMGALSLEQAATTPSSDAFLPSYNRSWWSLDALEALEAASGKPLPAHHPSRKIKPNTLGNYSSLTQSFTAKVVDPSKVRVLPNGRSVPISRAPTPPPPDVDWTVATHELCKLLIPTDRQTYSCRPEELAEVKVKKEKPSVALPPPIENGIGGRVLRERRPKAVSPDLPPLRSESRADRRKTIAVPLSAEMVNSVPDDTVKTSRRRMSVASSVSSISSVAPSLSSTRTSSVKPQGDLQSKRVRAPAATRADPRSRTTAPRPAVNRVPSGAPSERMRPVRQNTEGSIVSTTSRTTARSSHAPSEPSAPKNDSGMDDLAGMIRKIKINVPTDEEYEQRIRKKEEEAARKKAEEAEKKKKIAAKPTARKAAAPKTSKSTTAKKAVTQRPLAGTMPIAPSPPIAAPDSIDGSTIDVAPQPPVNILNTSGPITAGASMPVPLESIPAPVDISNNTSPVPELPLPVTSPPRPDTPPPPPPAAIMEFINQHPPTSLLSRTDTGFLSASGKENQPEPPNAQQFAAPQPLQWMPMNSDVPQVNTLHQQPGVEEQKKRVPPVFTADGVIPFAPKLAHTDSVSPPIPEPRVALLDSNLPQNDEARRQQIARDMLKSRGFGA